MNQATQLQVGDWRVDGPGCRIDRDGEQVSLEPKVMDLLLLLAAHAGEVVGKNSLLEALWPGVVVGDDTLARTVSKLRSALADDVRQPEYIETVPKRGYRLIAAVSVPESPSATAHRPSVPWMAAVIVVLIAAAAGLWLHEPGTEDTRPSDAELLIGRADDFYMRFTQADNAAAIDLYERVIAMEPDNARAQAGLANALVQRVIRWQEGASSAGTLGTALEVGLTETPQARELLGRAQALAERAARLSPDDADVLKALGLVYSAAGRIDDARRQYERAIELDRDAWEPLVNLGELAKLGDDPAAAVDYYTRAYEIMQRLYDREPQKIGPWHAPLGVDIGRLYEETGNPEEAEVWYRRILRLSPYEPEATARLAMILAAAGDLREALALCRKLQAAGSGHALCDELLAGSASTP